MKFNDLFTDDYEVSRERFKSMFPGIRERWPGAIPISYKVNEEEDLTIDCIRADALDEPEMVLILSTGQHGIEGYLGAVIMLLFLEEYLDKLNPENTGLVLVHAINPWGMKHFRKVNQNNVDLNRNFVVDKEDFGKSTNPAYDSLVKFISPERRLPPYPLALFSFFIQVIWHYIVSGEEKIKLAALLGQFTNPKGMFYGGDTYQKETSFIMGLLEEIYSTYTKIVHLDMHTGFGPRFQMSIVNANREKRKPDELSEAFNYPLVLTPTSDEFYEIQGDMLEWEYYLMERKYPEKSFYAAAFEFGTLGNSMRALLKSLHAMIFENQDHWHGSKNNKTHQKVVKDFKDLYFPEEERWRIKALEDASRAFSGILQAEGFI